jgi:hypothetical protein
MSESTLSLTYDTIKVSVAQFLGYGRTSGNWTAEQSSVLDEIIQRGIRQFYFPKNGHVWSFLKPTTSLTMTSSNYNYDMPDDFGGLASEMSYSPDITANSITIVPETKILSMRQKFNAITGKPYMCAIRQLTTYPNATEGSRYEVIFYPTPDSAYTVYYQYHILMNKLVTSTNPNFYGGMAHSETILESCLAVAEKDINDTLGIHNTTFNEMLVSSTELDLRRFSPIKLGYNSDKSDCIQEDYRDNAITINGVPI